MNCEKPQVINLEDKILDDSKRKFPKKKKTLLVE